MIKKLTLVIFLLTAISIGPTCFETFGAVTPSALKCEYFVDPKGIDSLAPMLSWILISVERGQKQTAYQISDVPDIDPTRGDAVNIATQTNTAAGITNAVTVGVLLPRIRHKRAIIFRA